MWERILKTLVAIIIVAGAPLAIPDASDAGQRGRGRANGNRIYQDSASATGYGNGYDLGRLDGRDGQRYDPVRHKDYRDAQRGYAQSYGSREGYRTNFRSGFRQGYEDGYREGARTRR